MTFYKKSNKQSQTGRISYRTRQNSTCTIRKCSVCTTTKTMRHNIWKDMSVGISVALEVVLRERTAKGKCTEEQKTTITSIFFYFVYILGKKRLTLTGWWSLKWLSHEHANQTKRNQTRRGWDSEEIQWLQKVWTTHATEQAKHNRNTRKYTLGYTFKIRVEKPRLHV